MKRIFTLLVFVFSFCTSKADYWTQMDTCISVSGINASNAFVINGKAYVLGGYYSIPGYSFFEYDPVVDTWIQKANFPVAIYDGSVGFSIGTKGYIGVGRSLNNYMDQLWEYDPVSDSWLQKANFPGTKRVYPFVFTIGTSAFIGCGQDSMNVALADVWEYNQTVNVWTQKANFPYSDGFLTGVSYLNKGYVSHANTSLSQTEMWSYDPTLNLWTQKSGCTHLMSQNSSFIIGDNMFVGMGFLLLTDFWRYNITDDTWNQVSSFPDSGRFSPLSFSIGNNGYVGFGDFPYPFIDLYKYTPDSVTGLNEQQISALSMEVFPNPVYGNGFSLSISPPPRNGGVIQIYNNFGDKIFSQPLEKNDFLTSVNVATLVTGIYFIKVIAGKEERTFKFFKE